jgi:isoquinoline 1-oxidoreductase beta subunit
MSVDRATGKIKVHNIWAAIDAGLAVQPKNFAYQTEGSIVFGLGHVLEGRAERLELLLQEPISRGAKSRRSYPAR